MQRLIILKFFFSVFTLSRTKLTELFLIILFYLKLLAYLVTASTIIQNLSFNFLKSDNWWALARPSDLKFVEVSRNTHFLYIIFFFASKEKVPGFDCVPNFSCYRAVATYLVDNHLAGSAPGSFWRTNGHSLQLLAYGRKVIVSKGLAVNTKKLVVSPSPTWSERYSSEHTRPKWSL